MTAHYAAIGLLALVMIHFLMSGGFGSFLARHARVDSSGSLRQHNPNAVLAVAVVFLVWAAALLVLIIPSVPKEIEVALGLLMIVVTLAARVVRRNQNARSFLMLASGALILAGSLV